MKQSKPRVKSSLVLMKCFVLFEVNDGRYRSQIQELQWDYTKTASSNHKKSQEDKHYVKLYISATYRKSKAIISLSSWTSRFNHVFGPQSRFSKTFAKKINKFHPAVILQSTGIGYFTELLDMKHQYLTHTYVKNYGFNFRSNKIHLRYWFLSYFLYFILTFWY